MNYSRSWKDLVLSFKMLDARARIRPDDTITNLPGEISRVAEEQEQSKHEITLYMPLGQCLMLAANEKDEFEVVKLCQRVLDTVLSGRTPTKFDADVVLNFSNSGVEFV